MIVLTMIAPALSSAGDQPECRYCRSWVPTYSTFGAKYERQVASTFSVSSVTLPFCKPLAAERLTIADEVYGLGMSEDVNQKPQTALYRVKAKPNCVLPQAGLKQGSLLRVELWPREIQEWNELHVSLYSPEVSVNEVLHGGQVLEYLQAEPGKKRKVKRLPIPSPSAEWWFVREGHNPCEEGTHRGEILCEGWVKP